MGLETFGVDNQGLVDLQEFTVEFWALNNDLDGYPR